MHHDNSNNTRNIKYKENEKLLLLPSLLLIIYIYIYIYVYTGHPRRGRRRGLGARPAGPSETAVYLNGLNHLNTLFKRFERL